MRRQTHHNARQISYWLIGVATLLTAFILIPLALLPSATPTPAAARTETPSSSTTPTATPTEPAPNPTAISQLPATITPSPVANHVYYVSPDGDDANSGEIDSPWRTIDYALGSSPASAGDIIQLREGVYQEGTLIFNQDGPQGQDGEYLTLQNYPGETATLRGTALRIRGRSYIRITGLHFDEIPVVPLAFEARTRPITSIQVIDNIFNNTTRTADVTFIRVTSWGGRNTPPLYLRVTNVLIDGNQLLDDNTNIPDDKADALQIGGNVDYLRITNNYLRRTTSIGITIAGRSWHNDERFGKDSDDVHPDQADYVLIKGNTVEGVNGNGIYLDAPGDYLIVEDNVVFNSGKNGVMVAGEGVTSGMSYRHGIVRRNIAYNNYFNSNFGSRDVAHSTEADECNQVVQSDSIVFVHNTFFSDEAIGANSRHQCGTNYRLKNNIIVNVDGAAGKQYDVSRDFVDPSTWELDYNLFFSGDQPKSFKWIETVYQNFADYRAGTGQDQHSIETDPHFANPQAGDFRLNPTSPAIDAGGALTFSDGSGSSSTTLKVHDARYFTDGFGLQPGDWIRVGSGPDAARRQVVAVDYDTHILTLDQPAFWSDNTAITYDYAGNAPDIGAYEYPSGN